MSPFPARGSSTGSGPADTLAQRALVERAAGVARPVAPRRGALRHVADRAQ